MTKDRDIERCAYMVRSTESDVVYVFSCPGRIEQEQERPVGGMTGKNLDRVIKILNEECGQSLPLRVGASINNAWPKPEFRSGDGATGRSQATLAEIRDPTNLQRLKRELSGYSLIVCFGKRAHYAVRKLFEEQDLGPGVAVANARHLGLSSLNQLRKTADGRSIADVYRRPSDRTTARLRMVAEELCRSIRATANTTCQRRP